MPREEENYQLPPPPCHFLYITHKNQTAFTPSKQGTGVTGPKSVKTSPLKSYAASERGFEMSRLHSSPLYASLPLSSSRLMLAQQPS